MQKINGVPVIYTFTRDQKTNQLNGCIVAARNDDETIRFNVGWSRVGKKDRFDKEMALKIAFGRSQCKREIHPPHPDVKDEYINMFPRAQRYFKP